MSRRVPLVIGKSEHETARINVPDADACSWVVTLSAWKFSVRGIGANPPDAAHAKPLALVEWGHGQVPHQAILDWPGQGQTFVVHGTFVRVILQNTTLGNLPGTDAQPVFTAGATIVPGQARESQQPTITSEIRGLLPGGQSFHGVPAFARGVRFYNMSNAAGPADVPLQFSMIWRSDVTAAVIYGHQRHNTSPDLWITATVNVGWTPNGCVPIPTAANRLEIVNRDAAVNLDLNVQWILDLG